MLSLGVSSVDLRASTCDFVLDGVESRGSHFPCLFSVGTTLFVARRWCCCFVQYGTDCGARA